MNYSVQFVYPWATFIASIIVAATSLWQLKFPRRPRYTFALTGLMKQRGCTIGWWRMHVLTAARCSLLGMLALAVGRPQLADMNSLIPVEGIDIMLVLDVSGSMVLFDDLNDRRSRFEVARTEAQRFVSKRKYDQIGLVLFAADVVARLPLTLDKELINEVLGELRLGIIDYRATMLMTGIATAAHRLRSSKAKSKVIIVLTDGKPAGDALEKKDVIEIVKKIGAKIYTIGVGNNNEYAFLIDDHDMLIPCTSSFDEQLLMEIAQETGGRYFAAQKPQDMKKIYDVIDALEKTEIKSPLYHTCFELGIPLLLGALLVLIVEALLRFGMWKLL